MPENRIKEIRTKLGMSQVVLSRKSKIAAPLLSAIENGKILPWKRAKRALSRVLGEPIEVLFPEQTQGISDGK